MLAAGFAVLPFLPATKPSTDAWLATGLIAALAALAVVAVALLALAREVGELRLAIAPQAALSLEGEGPPLGSHLALIDRFEKDAPLCLAVFSSPGCALCRALEPSLRLVASDPEVELEIFDEEQDAEAWRELAIPGSPYAVVLSPDGEALAKGTFELALPARERARRRDRTCACLARRSPSRPPAAGSSPAPGSCCSPSAAAGSSPRRSARTRPEAFHFCGHIYTTGSCPHPTGLPRIDAAASRCARGTGTRSTTSGGRSTGPASRSTRTATRCSTRTAPAARGAPHARVRWRARPTASVPTYDGSWYRCCGGHIRRLTDCCGYVRRRINGDAALTGYCYHGRRVFCVMYYDTKVKC